ncbi:MAG: B12-binding domain-containing radical SAM protein, partial [Candidatus Hodarchaeota archaeon]
MKILLINPEIPLTFWSFKNALKFISKKALLPPLGLLTVAAMLPRDWEIKLIDMAATKLRDRDIQWADYVFITAMQIQRKSADQVIERCRKIGAKVVAGGPLFTSLPEKYAHVDHLVLKEAELTLPPFIKDLQEGCPRKLYNTHEKANLRETPIPLWNLVNMKKYALACIQYSRGCPFNCDFCDVTKLFGNKIRMKTTEQVLDELESLYSFGWRDEVFFVDDNFIGNKAHLKTELLPAIIGWMKKRQYPFPFNTQASINLADDEELMRLMVEAGFDCVFIGIETPSEDSLSECNKVQNKGRDLVACVKKIQQSGMQVQGGFILGFDSDKTSVFDSLIQFIQQSGVVTAMVGLLNAPRGTKLYRRLMTENRLLKDATGDNTDFSMNFIPKMKSEELLNGYRKVVSTIYSPRNYYERVLTFLRDYKPGKNNKVKFRLCDMKALLKSIWRLGIMGKGRLYYWKLLFWSLRRPRYFHLAVTLAIYGFHFRKMFGDY